MPKTFSAAVKAKAWTYEAKAIKNLAQRPRPDLEDSSLQIVVNNTA